MIAVIVPSLYMVPFRALFQYGDAPTMKQG